MIWVHLVLVHALVLLVSDHGVHIHLLVGPLHVHLVHGHLHGLLLSTHVHLWLLVVVLLSVHI